MTMSRIRQMLSWLTVLCLLTGSASCSKKGAWPESEMASEPVPSFPAEPEPKLGPDHENEPMPEPKPGSADAKLRAIVDLLPSGAHEEPGFKLYAYMLFNKPPRDARSVEAVSALLDLLDPRSSLVLSSVAMRQLLTAVYVPVRESSDLQSKDPAHAVLDSYDLNRSRALLQALKLKGSGPYLVVSGSPLFFTLDQQAVVRPFSAGTAAAKLDLSRIPPRRMRSWVSYYAETILAASGYRQEFTLRLAFMIARDACANLGNTLEVVSNASSRVALIKPSVAKAKD